MLVTAATYLTYAEAVDLYNKLLEIEVVALVKSCGPPSFPYGEGLYYQLLIEEANVEAAQETLTEFAAQRTEPRLLRCPRCGATEVAPAPRVAWWKRLLYAGTTLYSCHHCGKEFAG